MKRIVFIYISIIIGQIILTIILSNLLNVSTGNTWLGIIFGNSMGLTMVKMFLDMSKFIRKKHLFVAFFLVFCSLSTIAGLILGNIAFFMGW